MENAQNLEGIAPSSTALDRYETEQPSAVAIRSLDDIRRLSLIFIKSGMFKGDRQLSDEQKMYQAGVKIIAGVEFGIQPFAAMRGINIINGNAEMSANLMAAKVKSHPKYDYKVPTWTNDKCIVEFYEVVSGTKGEPTKLGESSFSLDDAKRAGLMNNATWSKFPRNMLFARAISNGVRVFAPDIFYGAPVYVEGEISGNFEETPKDEREPAEAEIVDAAAPDVDQLGSPQPDARATTKAAVEKVEAELAEESVEPTTQWSAHEVAQTMGAAETDVTTTTRRLDPKKTQRIYKLGRQLKLDMKKLEKRVSELANNAEADEAVAILEQDLAAKQAEQQT